jgi:quercetin dioxygenase-like cupin family protein
MEFNKVKIVDKPWGREVIFAVEDKYVGKIIEVEKGKRYSLQYHKKKKETQYVLKGKIKLTLGDETQIIDEGKSFTVNPGTKHRVEALEDARIIEVSTTELDDVVRLEDDYGRVK